MSPTKAKRRAAALVPTDDAIVDLGRYWQALDRKERELAAQLLDSADIALLERARAIVAGEGWRATPLSMGVHFGELSSMPHTEFLAQKFVDAVEGRSVRQIWNMPPQHGKSLIASQWGPAWALARSPELPLALASYGKTLAVRNSVRVRDILTEHADALKVHLRRDRRRADLFVTEQGGSLLAAGVGSTLTGFGAAGIIVDDPHKDWQEAHSDARREAVWDWYRSVVRSRLWDRPERPGWIILVMTRWHEDDLTGRLLTGDDDDEWELVRLPAIAEAADPNSSTPMLRVPDLLGRAPGEALAPELYSIEALLKRARDFGSYLTAGLEQQRPAPAEGGEIKRVWWKWTTTMPTEGDQWITSWDMKLKEKETGDYQVGQVWSRTGSAFFGHAQLRGQWTMLKTACAIALLAIRYPKATRHYVENSGNGPEVMQILRGGDPNFVVPNDVGDELAMTPAERKQVGDQMRRGLPGIIPVTPRQSKLSRARAVAAFLEGGNVWLPEGKDWAHALVDECAAFPQGNHDDMVDTWSQAMAALSGRIRSGVGPQGGTAPSQWRE